MTIIITGRCGGLHKPPQGLSLAEPIGSSNYLSLACPALPPLCADWGIVKFQFIEQFPLGIVGAIINRPPNNLQENYWDFRRKYYIIAYRR